MAQSKIKFWNLFKIGMKIQEFQKEVFLVLKMLRWLRLLTILYLYYSFNSISIDICIIVVLRPLSTTVCLVNWSLCSLSLSIFINSNQFKVFSLWVPNVLIISSSKRDCSLHCTCYTPLTSYSWQILNKSKHLPTSRQIGGK